MILNRRALLKYASLVPGGKILGFSAAFGDDRQFNHGLSLFGDLKYPADFKHFDYVNPTAPKGGRLRLSVLGSFDSLNPHTIKGDAFAQDGTETLLTASLDEPGSKYGLLAREVWHPEDRSLVVFRLHPEARFHDGKAITPEDVIWSFEAIKTNLPTRTAYYRNVTKVEQTGDHEVTFVFNQKGNRELPSIAGEINVLPRHWWTGKDAAGKERNVANATQELPLGSGPYRVASIQPGQTVLLRRVKDYWGAGLSVNVGADNFDEIEYIYFRDQVVAFEAFKGDQYDFRIESSSKYWATGYDFPAVKQGRCILEKVFLEDVEPIQAWVLNLRREKFQDVRVRRALDLAFDFEWSNQNLFYGQYTRARSIFNNSELEAKGLPSAEELALLEPLKPDLPPEVFTQEYVNPVNDTPQSRRKNLREAASLLDAAGWKVTQDGNKSLLKNAEGERLNVEFLLDSPLFERIALPYQQQLELLGIGVTIRNVDPAQYERRTKDFDYDIISGIWGQTLSPGNEQRFMWGSESADKPGSQNYAGIKDKAIDALIEKVIFATDRKSLVTACRALDRAVMAHHYLIPMWYADFDRLAYWNRFGRPERLPAFSTGFPLIWWWDEAKAKASRA